MATVLAADLGGTKTLLSLRDRQGRLLAQQRYASAEFTDFAALLQQFVDRETDAAPIAAACLAIAGPVTGREARVTNLPWRIDADALARQFKIDQLLLKNDFEALAYSIPTLEPQQLMCLQAAEPDDGAPRLVMGAGTGLGQAILMPEAAGWRVLAGEGGHVDFAPNDLLQSRLLDQLRQRFAHVSVERLVSGPGLVTIYDFLRDYLQIDETAALRAAMTDGDAAAAISRFASLHGDPLAQRALTLFIQLFGAHAGNAALSVLPRGGVYIAGGIAAKNSEAFAEGGFIQAFNDKGRMQPLLSRLPVFLVLETEAGLRGAELLAAKALYN